MANEKVSATTYPPKSNASDRRRARSRADQRVAFRRTSSTAARASTGTVVTTADQ